MIKNGFLDPKLCPLHISAILTKRKIFVSLIFRDLSFEIWLQQSPLEGLILIKLCHNLAKGWNKEFIKFGNHSLRGFRVAANSLMVQDKDPPIGNRVIV